MKTLKTLTFLSNREKFQCRVWLLCRKIWPVLEKYTKRISWCFVVWKTFKSLQIYEVEKAKLSKFLKFYIRKMSPKSGETTTAKPADDSKKDSADSKDTKKESKKDETKEEELSEEDKQLKEELELCVTRLQEDDKSLYAGKLIHIMKNPCLHWF